MKITSITTHPYKIPLSNGQMRSGLFVNIQDERGKSTWGEIAPLPNWSQETLEQAVQHLKEKQSQILQIQWNAKTYHQDLERLNLLPSVLFGLESALLELLDPLHSFSVPASALLMGSQHEILQQAELRYKEGFTTAKLKVSNLSFGDATDTINQLKTRFRLRIDVNRAWSTSDSLRFFLQFPKDLFEYVEEPFQNPHDLAVFIHPLAVDESYPNDLSLEQLEKLPTLKAMIYKPTIQGGLLNCLKLHEWTTKKGISLVLSSSFESDLGLAHVAAIAHRLSLLSAIGIGTYHFLSEHVCSSSLQFSNSHVNVESPFISPLSH